MIRRVDDESRPVGDSLDVEDTEICDELTVKVRQHREGEVLQVLVLQAPGVVDELVVDRAPEHLCVTIGELVVQPPELGDLGWADECEVLGPEEDDRHLPS